MGISKCQSYKDLATKILYIYKQILNDPYSSLDKDRYRFIIDRIGIIKKVIKFNNLSLNSFSIEELIDFLETILDSYGFSLASGNNSDDLTISNLTLIGRKKERLDNLTDVHINDFQFSKLFQGWWNNNRKKKIKDLNQIIHAPIRRCDYAVPVDAGSFELVECSRISPSDSMNVSLEDLAYKIKERVNGKAAQLSETKKYFSDKYKTIINCSNFLIDISSYCKEKIKGDEGFEIVGFTEDKLKDLYQILSNEDIDKKRIDRLIICWSRKVFKDGLPIAIIQSVFRPLLLSARVSKLNYKGWTIEAYPRNENLSLIREIRLSTCDRGLAWVKASYFGEIDQLLTYGVEESYKDKN